MKLTIEEQYDKLYNAVQAIPHWDLHVQPSGSRPATEADRTTFTGVMGDDSSPANLFTLTACNASGNLAENQQVEGLDHSQGLIDQRLSIEPVLTTLPNQPALPQNADTSGQAGDTSNPVPAGSFYDTVDGDWWNTSLSGHVDSFEGLDWLDFSQSESWSYLT